MGFKPETKSRCWMVVLHVTCLLKLGIPEDRLDDYEFIAEVVSNAWEYSGSNRTCAVIVCVSADGVLHVHMAAYGPPTTLRYVSNTLGNAHVEPQLAGKKRLTEYLLKQGEFEEKGEKILFQKGIDNIQNVHQGKRSDLDEIELMLKAGASPQEIFDRSIRFRKYENMILKTYYDIRAAKMPVEKVMNNYWHFGNGRTGKSHSYVELCEQYGRNNIYFLTDFQNGGFDTYMAKGAPKILFIDDVKPFDMKYRQLLMLTDKYTDAQTHSRYSNTLNLWTEVHVTSVYPIEEYYKQMVPEDQRKTDDYDQLIGRFNTIVYHYIDFITGEYKSYSMPADEYVDANYMKIKARGGRGYQPGAIPLPEGEEKINYLKSEGLI